MSRETMDQSEQHELGFLDPILAEHAAGGKVGRVCPSRICDQAGGPAALRPACRHFGTEPGEVTPDGEWMVEESPCLGLCDHAPAALVGETPVGGIDPSTPARWMREPEPIGLGLVGGMARPLSGRCGVIDPSDLAAFEAHGGFRGLRRALESLTPAQVITAIKAAGLSGRGGGGLPPRPE